MEQRHDAIVAGMRDGFTDTEAAQQFGVSRPSLFQWMARYEEGGLEALSSTVETCGPSSELSHRRADSYQ